MPVYVYHCSNCEFEFEQQQKFTDKPLKSCPECGQSTLHKVYTPVSVIYKGSGFYSTDHRSSSSTSSINRDKKEEKKEGEKTEKKDTGKENKKEAVKTEKKSEPEKAKSTKAASED